MEIIISHVNTDFDALASMIAAKKLHPNAQLVLSDKQDDRVTRYLNIYRDMFDFVRDVHVDWSQVTKMILVDVATLRRVGRISDEFDEENVEFIVYDHHPEHENNVKRDGGIVEPIGAAVTLLLEKIQEQQLPLSEFEATLFGLGLYTDTGNFIYKNTRPRDLQAASYLMEKGMNLEIVQRFSEQTLEVGQQELLDALLSEAKMYAINGLEIIVSTHELEKFQGGLALVTNKLLEIKGGDAALAVVKMKNHVHVVGRANSERITLLPILKKLGGGGHQHAGSATIKRAERKPVLEDVLEHLETMLKPAVTAKDIMSHPVKSLTPDTTIEEAGRLMYRYGHSGYPIVEDGKLVGLITRRDLDKGNHHGLGHAPVKAYMTTNVVTINANTTLEDMQKLIIDRNIGRLPIIEKGEIIGIVTRTNIIEMIHNEILPPKQQDNANLRQYHLEEIMEAQLPQDIFQLLKEISATSERMAVSVYLIGGIVRDILLEKPNDDIDIVVEGDGILFAQGLKEDYGGKVLEHGSFGTAMWTHPSGLTIDITSSRLEYYDRPASLPDVELSTLEEDLHRRDFTINAMALRLNPTSFGELIDPFGGQEDLQDRKIQVLHNISFVEDPTRIFRAIRFEERFHFLMDEQTEKLALNSIDKVKELTASRIIEEMKRLFKEGNPAAVNARLFALNFWRQFNVDAACKEVSCHASRILQTNYQKFAEKGLLKDEQASWFNYFLLPLYMNKTIDDARKFALTKEDVHLLDEIIHLMSYTLWDEVKHVGEYHSDLTDYSTEAIVFILAAHTMNNKALVEEYLVKRHTLPKYFSGQDLMARGLKPGPFFSTLFLQLEISQLNEEVTSEKDAEKWLETFIHTSTTKE